MRIAWEEHQGGQQPGEEDNRAHLGGGETDPRMNDMHTRESLGGRRTRRGRIKRKREGSEGWEPSDGAFGVGPGKAGLDPISFRRDRRRQVVLRL